MPDSSAEGAHFHLLIMPAAMSSPVDAPSTVEENSALATAPRTLPPSPSPASASTPHAGEKGQDLEGAAPWLSFLIPVYNVHQYLRECLVSVATQCDRDIEIVVLDDRSTDGSAELLRQLAVELSSLPVQLVTLFHTDNQGISAVRNGLLDAARGEYIWFLDSDDRLLPGAVEQFRDLVRREAPELVLCDFSVLRQAPRLKHRLKRRLRGDPHRRTFIGPQRQPVSDPSTIIRGLFQAGHLHCWSKIAKRSVWKGLRFPVGKYFEDITLAAPLLLQASSVWYEPRVWVAYRQREGSILATPSLVKAEHLSVSLLHLPARLKNLQLDEQARFAWSHFLACNFIGTARTAQAALPQEHGRKIASFRSAFLQSCPMSLPELYAAYASRGWFLRALRLRHWLRRATSD